MSYDFDDIQQQSHDMVPDLTVYSDDSADYIAYMMKTISPDCYDVTLLTDQWNNSQKVLFMTDILYNSKYSMDSGIPQNNMHNFLYHNMGMLENLGIIDYRSFPISIRTFAFGPDLAFNFYSITDNLKQFIKYLGFINDGAHGQSGSTYNIEYQFNLYERSCNNGHVIDYSRLTEQSVMQFLSALNEFNNYSSSIIYLNSHMTETFASIIIRDKFKTANGLDLDPLVIKAIIRLMNNDFNNGFDNNHQFNFKFWETLQMKSLEILNSIA